MGLDFMMAKNNRFKTCERRSFQEELINENIFSNIPHLLYRQFCAYKNENCDIKPSFNNEGFLIQTNRGIEVIIGPAPSQAIGFLIDDAATEIKQIFKENPNTSNVLPVKILSYDQDDFVFNVEIINIYNNE
ncbi:MAG: hypothetical protein SFT91_01865 [Rickettsiaceae bacterium]|nr:hypothetical protein [Rickettsiaceae bacterium]